MKFRKFTESLEEISFQTLSEITSSVEEVKNSLENNKKIITSTKQRIINFTSNSDSTKAPLGDIELYLSTVETKVQDTIDLLNKVENELTNSGKNSQETSYEE